MQNAQKHGYRFVQNINRHVPMFLIL